MKTLNSIRIVFTVLILSNLLLGCGDGITSNQQLDNLPGMAKNYSEKIANLKKEIKESTDMEKAFKLDKEWKNLKKEADEAIKEYLVKNPITDVPFEQKAADYQFKINKVFVEKSSYSRIHYKAEVNINEDIVSKYGNPKKNIFAYVIAVDKEGKSLTRRQGVFMGENKKGVVEMRGSLDGPADLVNFEKLVFVSKDTYEKNK